jgi:peroxiredoxin Q/BCP
VGVSPDPVQTQQRFKKAHSLPFLMVGDPGREIIKLYGVDRRLLGPKTKRVTFLIDRAGMVKGVFHHEMAIGRHRAEVIEGLRRLNRQPQER